MGYRGGDGRRAGKSSGSGELSQAVMAQPLGQKTGGTDSYDQIGVICRWSYQDDVTVAEIKICLRNATSERD